MKKSDLLFDWDAVEIYKAVLSGKIRRFPNGFWQKPEAPENSIKCVKFLIEDILKWKEEDIKNNFNNNTLIKNKLSGMLQLVYDGSSYRVINALYPNNFKPWELQVAPMNYWNDKTAKEAIKWLIEEKLKWNDEQIKENISKRLFEESGISTALQQFNNSPYKAINAVYPNKFKPWELKTTISGYWNQETAKDAIKWLIEEKLKWNNEQIKENFNLTLLEDNKLYGVIQLFNAYEALNNAYPDKFKPWELRYTSNNYWNKQTAVIATKWLIEEKLKWNDEQIKERFNSIILKDNRLDGVLNIFDSIYQLLNNIYPNKFKPWELSRISRKFWKNNNNIKEAIKWLLDEKLKTNNINKITITTINKYGLNTILNYYNIEQIKNIAKEE